MRNKYNGRNCSIKDFSLFPILALTSNHKEHQTLCYFPQLRILLFDISSLHLSALVYVIFFDKIGSIEFVNTIIR